MSTIDYYNNNVQKFKKDIVLADVDEIINIFLGKIVKGGKILDAGCGTGRDSITMLNRGFKVEAFDAAPNMAKFASENTGLNVKVATFENVQYEKESFDAILALASLLHVDKENMKMVFDKLYSFLKDGGFLFASYKIGEEDYIDEFGRKYTCYTQESFEKFVKNTKFSIDYINIRHANNNVTWLNCILRK